MNSSSVSSSDGLVRWDERGTPFSVRFDDQYFCKDNGYDEARHVCLDGNNLPERFTQLPSNRPGTFTILETGFGTGLDFCCTWELWDRHAPASWSLRFISLELFPLTSDQISQALRIWPSLSRYQRDLAAQYRPVPGGSAEFSFDAGRVHLTLVFDHVVSALRTMKEQGWAGEGADAVFLDGFAPSKNPEMWSEDVFAGIAALSKLGATFSTYTVAGFVRRGLESKGFVVQKIPGHGKKRQILSGCFGGKP